MLARLLAHLRRQWMGALALFLVLSGGTAYAANTVFSSDIVNDQVFSADVRNDDLAGGGLAAADLRAGAVGSAEVLNDTASGGGLAAPDLRTGSVGPAEATGLGSADIANVGVNASDDVNANLLDGRDSSGYVQGSGRLLINRMVLVPADPEKLVLQIPGLGELDADCSNTDGELFWRNTTTSTIDTWNSGTGNWSAGLAVPGNAIGVANSDFFEGGTVALGLGNDPGPRRIAIVHGFAFQSSDGAPCGFQAQVTVWTSE